MHLDSYERLNTHRFMHHNGPEPFILVHKHLSHNQMILCKKSQF
jgi:hypothetical protein